MTLIFDEERTPEAEVVGKLNEAANGALKYEQFSAPMIENTEISVSFVSKEEIRELNKTYRDTDAVTDVLSFPQYDDLSDIIEGDIIELGDVVICEERCREQAEEFGHSFERELVYLFTHSVFHLLGYDHMTDEDKAEMRKAEEKVLGDMGLTREE